MPEYQVHFFDREGQLVSAPVRFQCESSIEALARAKGLNHVFGGELRCGDDVIGRIAARFQRDA